MRELFYVEGHVCSVSLERRQKVAINIITDNIFVREMVFYNTNEANDSYINLNESRLAYILNNTVLLSKRSKYTLISYTLN